MRDYKYLLAFLPILSVYLGFYLGGVWTYSGLIIAFVIIPLLEFIAPTSTQNLSVSEESSKLKDQFYDFLLYLNMPLLYGLLAYFCFILNYRTLADYEITGMIFSMGVIIGTCGINVGHELGHRITKYEQTFSKILLLPALYMHFFIEHNKGHHKNVATEEDPASARYNELIYTFFFRSVFKGYFSAWKIENTRLQRLGKPIFSWENEMIRFQIIQLIYLTSIAYYFGFAILIYCILAAVIGFLLLETVNYIEHYGLKRQKLPSGRYEPVQPHHSWNSNHEVGRIVLYELTRHSDHHFKATRKYQTLRHFDKAPQLPFGYPMSMLIALIPPLWFKLMNPRVNQG